MKVTKTQRLKCQIHVVPVSDSGIRHVVSTDCECKPQLNWVAKAVVVTHNMVGSGPDKWGVEARDMSNRTLEGVAR